MRKILLFGNCNGYGGAQTAFRQMAAFLVTIESELSIIGICDDAAELSKIPASGFRSRVNSGASNWRERLWRGAQIGRVVLKARAFCPDVFISVGLARTACIISRSLNHNSLKICQDFIHGRNINDTLLKRSRDAFDFVAVQSPSMEQSLLAQGFDPNRITWLPCLPEPPVEGVKHHSRVPAIPIKLAYFGRLASNKGLDLLLQVIATKERNTLELDVWGTGSELTALETLRDRLGLERSVKFRGRYPSGREHAELLCAYDAVVLPSQCVEGIPLVLLEAMAYGVPFLATRIGAIPDCCENNVDVVLTQPDVNSLSVGIELLVEKLLTNSISPTRLREYYGAHFSPLSMQERWKRFISDPETFVRS